MNGQMKQSKDAMVHTFLEQVNPYERHKPIEYDLRKYAAFVREKGLSAKDITPEVLKNFVKVSR